MTPEQRIATLADLLQRAVEEMTRIAEVLSPEDGISLDGLIDEIEMDDDDVWDPTLSDGLDDEGLFFSDDY